jgi:hypothetical protein
MHHGSTERRDSKSCPSKGARARSGGVPPPDEAKPRPFAVGFAMGCAKVRGWWTLAWTGGRTRCARPAAVRRRTTRERFLIPFDSVTTLNRTHDPRPSTRYSLPTTLYPLLATHYSQSPCIIGLRRRSCVDEVVANTTRIPPNSRNFL